MTSSIFYNSTFITVFHRCCQPLSAPLLCSLKVVCASEDRKEKRDMKRKRARKRRRRCTSACTLKALHTAACVLALIKYTACCKTRVNKDGCCLKEEVHYAPLSAVFGNGFCLEDGLEYFLYPRVFCYLKRQFFCLPV